MFHIKQLLNFVLLLFVLHLAIPATAQLLPDFVDEELDNSLLKPVGITFDKKGNGYIWEQSGLVHLMDTSGVLLDAPFIDIREEVSEFVDHGLLGFTLDPEFSENGYVYLLYVVDPHHLWNYGTADYDPNLTIINEATIGRITRYKADASNDYQTVQAESRKVIIGATADSGFPVVASSHGVGTLTFGTDGTLLASCGETGSFVSSDAGDHPDSFFAQALEQNIITEAENVGAYRSQMLNSLNGKIIRIDPETGHGVPSNPFFEMDDPTSKQSKVWARGLRNPFRMYLDLETGSHNPEDAAPGVIYVGDVGASRWEELNIVTEGGLNFGWPIYEGMAPKNSFLNKTRDNRNAPNPLFGTDGCDKEYFTFHEMIVQPNAVTSPVFPNDCDPANDVPESYLPSVHQRPNIAWLNHNQMTDSVAVIPGFDASGNAVDYEIENPEAQVEGIHFNGSSSLGGFHYHGDNFPEEFHGRYFHGDFNGWISIFDFDENYKLINVDTFATAVKGIVDLEVNPHDGCLYYVKVTEGPGIHRICYGGDLPPVAVATADVYYGVSPLTVNLDASETFHPQNYPFELEWILPNGETSDEAILDFVFDSGNSAPTQINVELVVTDSLGNSDTEELIISLNNTPPSVDITSIEDGDLYPISDFTYLPLRAAVSDMEHSDESLTYEWQAFLFHNTHNHAGPIENSREAFALLEPVGCTNETYWYRIELTVTDAAGLSSKDVVEVFPNCDPAFGLDVILEGEAFAEFNSLSWNNNGGTLISSYELQRSANNTDFVSIETFDVPGGAGLVNYDDRSPIWGTNKYRVKVNKPDGTYDYSNKVTLEFPGDRNFSVYPNPTEGLLYIAILESRGNINFDLFDASGKLMYSQVWQDTQMDGIETSISIGDLANGVYYYQIRNGASTFNGSVIKVE